ncbi:MAG TPA: TetR/AcrR family transcriptional regulator [Pyrinomonadaceae bacterium]|nr:TetR/AcrR family transcriptional regulator [Pyrinomonadaceae bacterium]
MIRDFFKCEHEGRMSGDERRRQILQIAIDLFSKHGFRGTTTRQIANAAGVSEAMVFRHFATKEDLYGAILGDKACHDEMKFPWEKDPVLQEAIQNKDDYTVFYNIALNAMTKQQADEGFMRLIFFSALEDHELADNFFNEFVLKVYEFIGGYIEQRQKDGAMRKMNPRVAVRALMGMMLHQSLNNILWDRKRRLLDITNEEAAKNFAEILLYGVKQEADISN